MKFYIVWLGFVAGAACGPASQADEKQQNATTPDSYVALHLGYPDSASGLRRLEHRGAVVYVTADPMLADSDLSDVVAHTVPGGVVLEARCLPEACSRLAEATRRNVGNRLALLLGGEPRSVLRIQSEVGAQGSLTITADASAAEADSIVSRLRSRWPTR